MSRASRLFSTRRPPHSPTYSGSRWKPLQIVLYGQGFGTGIAAQLASIRDCRRLILERPYYSMTSVFRRYLFLYPVGGRFLHYHLPEHEYLQKVTAPVTVIRGDDPAAAAIALKS